MHEASSPAVLWKSSPGTGTYCLPGTRNRKPTTIITKMIKTRTLFTNRFYHTRFCFQQLLLERLFFANFCFKLRQDKDAQSRSLPEKLFMKKMKPKGPFIPVERHGTIRREISSALDGRTLSAKEISTEVRISEKEVYEHLEHIQRSMNKKEHHLVINPAACMKCGFVFAKREKLKKPGKCPVCKGELIQEPLFSIAKVESTS